MDKLSKLGIKYGTDKIGKHHYLPVYHKMFKGRENTVLKVLEIGIAEGAGLRMFSEYFPNAIIYGVDNDRKRVESINSENIVDGVIMGQIIAIYGDQTKPNEFKEKLGHEFDLIVDDGSHVEKDQIETCQALFPLLSNDGYYVIEDVANRETYFKLLSFLDVGLITSEMKEVGDRYDDRLIILQKIKNNE